MFSFTVNAAFPRNSPSIARNERLAWSAAEGQPDSIALLCTLYHSSLSSTPATFTRCLNKPILSRMARFGVDVMTSLRSSQFPALLLEQFCEVLP